MSIAAIAGPEPEPLLVQIVSQITYYQWSDGVVTWTPERSDLP